MDSIDPLIKLTAVTSFALGLAGFLGAHVVKPVLSGISPLGTAVCLGLTPAIGIGIAAFTSDGVNLTSLFIATVVTIPLSWVLTNLFIAEVHVIHPFVGLIAGATTVAISAAAVASIGAAAFLGYRILAG